MVHGFVTAVECLQMREEREGERGETVSESETNTERRFIGYCCPRKKDKHSSFSNCQAS